MNGLVVLGLLFVTGGLLAYAVTIYNGLVALKNDVEKAWANIDVMLKQRHDELSKLLDCVKGYMDYERDTLQKITQARSMFQQAVTVDQKVQAVRVHFRDGMRFDLRFRFMFRMRVPVKLHG